MFYYEVLSSFVHLGGLGQDGLNQVLTTRFCPHGQNLANPALVPWNIGPGPIISWKIGLPEQYLTKECQICISMHIIMMMMSDSYLNWRIHRNSRLIMGHGAVTHDPSDPWSTLLLT